MVDFAKRRLLPIFPKNVDMTTYSIFAMLLKRRLGVHPRNLEYRIENRLDFAIYKVDKYQKIIYNARENNFAFTFIKVKKEILWQRKKSSLKKLPT
jgi:hypothetical protein